MSEDGTTRDPHAWSESFHGVWTTLGNSKAAETVEGVRVFDRPFPFFNAPTSLNDDESPLWIPALARTVTLGVELACRVGPVGDDGTHPVDTYHAFVAVRDTAHHAFGRQCANFSVGPHRVPDDPTAEIDYQVAQSWADGFAILSREQRASSAGFPGDAAMRLEVDGHPAVTADTSAYVHRFESVISAITRFVALDAGDVISLGVVSDFVTLPRGEALRQGARLTASVENVGTITVPILDARSEDNYYDRPEEAGP